MTIGARDRVNGVQEGGSRADLIKDGDFRLMGVLAKVTEEKPVIMQVWEMV